ncbi:cytochrome P450 [Actinoplanes sp. NPDC051470]|uniref:cytochrome P450 n=1 Tax=Actinoplanes sp. NPDC051470 TaxID=3157224 RepID=UPI0034120BF8
MPESVSTLPGPKPLPFVGNVPELSRGQKQHRVLERWTDEFGLTFRVRLGGNTVIVTADPAHADVILRRRPDAFQRNRRNSEIIDEIILPGVFTAEGDRWRRLRKVATQSLNVAYLRQYFATITMVTERLLRQWGNMAASGERIDVLDRMMRYTLDVTSGLAMGYDLNSLEATGEGLHSRIPMIFPAFTRRINSPVPYWRRSHDRGGHGDVGAGPRVRPGARPLGPAGDRARGLRHLPGQPLPARPPAGLTRHLPFSAPQPWWRSTIRWVLTRGLVRFG